MSDTANPTDTAPADTTPAPTTIIPRTAGKTIGRPAGKSLKMVKAANTNAVPKPAAGKGKGKTATGPKRYRKVIRDAIQGITKPAIRRLARRGGV